MKKEKHLHIVDTSLFSRLLKALTRQLLHLNTYPLPKYPTHAHASFNPLKQKYNSPLDKCAPSQKRQHLKNKTNS
ncbi:hypothetical protein NHG52_33660, partial [Bacillus thuringiensis]